MTTLIWTVVAIEALCLALLLGVALSIQRAAIRALRAILRLLGYTPAEIAAGRPLYIPGQAGDLQ